MYIEAYWRGTIVTLAQEAHIIPAINFNKAVIWAAVLRPRKCWLGPITLLPNPFQWLRNFCFLNSGCNYIYKILPVSFLFSCLSTLVLHFPKWSSPVCHSFRILFFLLIFQVTSFRKYSLCLQTRSNDPSSDFIWYTLCLFENLSIFFQQIFRSLYRINTYARLCSKKRCNSSFDILYSEPIYAHDFFPYWNINCLKPKCLFHSSFSPHGLLCQTDNHWIIQIE